MKSIILIDFGGVDKLITAELPMPVILKNEVLIKVKAIGINPVDVRTRAGSAMAGQLKDYRPLVLGWDISGEVVAVGADVTKFKFGDEVFGMINFLGHGKGYAEYVAAPEQHIAIKPPNISHEEAAAATLAALTAWQLLKHYAAIKRGHKILIQAASGGVGHYAVQMAKHLGAYVIGVSSTKNRDFVLEIGADRHIGYDRQYFEDLVKDLDFVVDAFAFDSLYRSLKVVKPGGKIMSLLPMISNDLKEQAMKKDVEVYYSLVTSNGDDMQAIAGLLEKGILKSHVSKVFPFNQMANAHLEVETGRTVGKVVVSV
jgi:NADPH:quinone reductase-like Zn-dependent oxidoreductase